MLVTILHQYPFVQPWLTVKIALLVVYIVLRSVALKRANTPGVRLSCWTAALIVYAFIISVARTRQPLGIFSHLT